MRVGKRGSYSSLSTASSVLGNAGLLTVLEADRVGRVAEHRLHDLRDRARLAVVLAVFVVENDLVFLLEAHALTFRWHA